jgi:hypothetical protein
MIKNSLYLWLGLAGAAWYFWPQLAAYFNKGPAAKPTTPSGTSAELLDALRKKLIAAGAKRQRVEELVEPLRIEFVMLDSE